MSGTVQSTSFEPQAPPAPRDGARPLRVLLLASFFPKPGNPLLGPWALVQAQALQRHGVDLRVASLTSWVPRIFARTRGSKAYAYCPPEHRWGDLPVQYPRWLFYQVEPVKGAGHKRPGPQMKLAWLSAARYLKRVIREWQPDVLFCHHTVPNGYMGLQLHKRFGIPFVVTDWAFEEVADCERYPNRRKHFAEIARHAHLMVAVAKRMENDWRRLFPGVRVRTVYNGTEQLPQRMWTVPRPPELEGKTVVLSVGAFAERKAFPLLIRAFGKVANKHPGAVLRIAGDGEERPQVEQAVRETGLGGRVHLLGFRPRDEVMQEMVWCDCFALPSWDEPFATVYMEAMSAGRPFIWAADGGISDVARDGVHGFAVVPKDVESTASALDRMLSDPAARRRMGEAGAELFRTKLNWDDNAREMVEILTEAAAARTTGRPSS